MVTKEKNMNLTDDNFKNEVLENDQPVLVDFWAEWCGPCQMIAPAIRELAETYSGKAKIAKLNVDDNPKTAAEYGVRSIPTLLLFKKGRMVERVVGLRPKHELAAKLNALLL